MRIASLMIAGAIAMPGLGVAGVATAEQPCPVNRVCVYANTDFTGVIGIRTPGGGIVDLPPHLEDRMRSWINRTNTDAAAYEHRNGRGKCTTMRKMSRGGFLEPTMSSWKTNGGCV